MAELLTTDTDLTTVADAIRTKTGKTGSLTFPTGFASEISGIGSYGTSGAGASHILSGKKAFVGNATVTGNIPSKGGETFHVSSTDQRVNSGQYLSGNQVFQGVKITGLTAENVKKGVTIKVGDNDSAGRLANVVGTYAPYTSMPNSENCFIPFMFKASDTLALTFYWNGRGFRVHGSGSGLRNFIVPCPIRITYYPEDDSTTTSQVTFQPGNVYTLGPYNYYVAMIYGGGLSNFHIYMITKWEAV